MTYLAATASLILAEIQRSAIEKLWHEAVVEVWGQPAFDKIKGYLVVSPEQPKGNVLASLSYSGTPKAIDRVTYICT